MKLKNEQNSTLFNSVMFIAMILFLHVALIAGLIVSVVLFKGIYDLRWWILAGGLLLIAGSGYFFYRRAQAGKQRLRDMIKDPAFQNRSLEISLLGGMATLRLGQQDQRHEQPRMIEVNPANQVKQLPFRSSSQVKELAELNRMLEEGLITRDEFFQLKKEII